MFESLNVRMLRSRPLRRASSPSVGPRQVSEGKGSSNLKIHVIVAGVLWGLTAAAANGRLETAHWQGLIDTASAQGGGTVSVPSGRHVVGQLYLKSNVELRLEEGALLEGAVGLHNYVAHTIPFSEGTMSAVVMGVGVTNVAISGKGTIFGNGRAFERVRTVGGCEEGFRPRGIFFGNARNVRLEDFTLRDAACWGIVIQRCDGVDVRRVKVDSVVNINNDGIDIEGKNVRVEDCDIQSGDDGICIKSNDPDYIVENIRIRRCQVRSHCTVLKLGTASHGTMRNVRFEQVTVSAPTRFYRDLIPMPTDLTVNRRMMGVPEYLCGPAMSAICVECVDGGTVEDVVFDDITVSGVSVPIHIRGGYRTGRSCGIPPGNRKILRNVVISNVRGRAEQARPSMILGCDACFVRDVVLRNIDIECRGEGAAKNGEPYSIPGEETAGSYPDAYLFKDYHFPAYGLFVDHATGVRVDNVRFRLAAGTVDNRPAISGL